MPWQWSKRRARRAGRGCIERSCVRRGHTGHCRPERRRVGHTSLEHFRARILKPPRLGLGRTFSLGQQITRSVGTQAAAGRGEAARLTAPIAVGIFKNASHAKLVRLIDAGVRKRVGIEVEKLTRTEAIERDERDHARIIAA